MYIFCNITPQGATDNGRSSLAPARAYYAFASNVRLFGCDMQDLTILLTLQKLQLLHHGFTSDKPV